MRALFVLFVELARRSSPRGQWMLPKVDKGEVRRARTTAWDVGFERMARLASVKVMDGSPDAPGSHGRCVMRTIVILACAVLAACSRPDKAATTEITSAPVDARPSDEELIRRVESAVSARPELSMAAKNAEVDAVDGNIVLRGSVSDQFVKNDIEKLAASVPGVVTT